MEDSISVSEARERLSDLVSECAFSKKSFILSRHGKRLAAVVPVEWLDEQENNKAINMVNNKAITT